MASDCISRPSIRSPLSPTNKLPSLRTCTAQQSAEQSRFAFVSAWMYFVSVYWSVCLCLQQKNGLSHLAQVMCHAFVLISYFVLHQKHFILSSASIFYFTAFIFSTFSISFLGFIPTTCWAEIRISHQGLWICHTPTLVYLQRQSEINFVTSVMKKSPHTKPQTKKWQYSIQTALSIKERNIKAKDTSLICAKRTSANKK